VDVVENSPPVIIWLGLPAVLVSRTTGWDSWFVWMGMVSLLGLASLALGWRVVVKNPASTKWTGPIMTALAVGLFLLPRQEYGQREHVAIALAFPWILAAAAKADSAPIERGLAWALALAGGLGLAIKPHFGLVWLAVAGVLLWRGRSLRALLAPEVAGPALAAAAAGAATLALHPDWLAYARLYGPLYQHFGRENPLWVGLVGEGVEWSWLGVLALLAFAPAIRPLPGGVFVLVAVLAGFHVAAALQMKGWGYHFLPAGVIGLTVAAIAACAGASGPWRTDRLARRVYRIAVPAGIAFAAFVGIRRATDLVVRPEAKWAESDPSLPKLLAAVRRSEQPATLLVLSTNIGAGFPLAHLASANWTMRHPSLWVIGAVYEQELRQPGLVRLRDVDSWTLAERRMIAELEEDASRRPPTMVIAPRATPEAPLWAASQRVRYAAHLEHLPSVRSAGCLDAPPAEVGAYLVWTCSPS
jgi:hypothetical protein